MIGIALCGSLQRALVDTHARHAILKDDGRRHGIRMSVRPLAFFRQIGFEPSGTFRLDDDEQITIRGAKVPYACVGIRYC